MATLKEVIAADVANIFMDSDGFADDFTFSRSGLPVASIFDGEFAVLVDDVESTSPAIKVDDLDIIGIRHGDTFTRLSDSIVYNVIGVQPDGTGVTTVILSQD